jgi:hypothetical protein
VQPESTMRCLIGVIRRVIGRSATARQPAACGHRQKISAAALTLIAAAAIIAVAGVAKSAEPNANPTCSGPRAADGSCPQIATVLPCPGRMTADELACCAPGSTPTGDDTCKFPGGGVAASCPLAQLTSSGTCCPSSSRRQTDGTCQSANGSTSASACPLSQLNQGALSCCPAGQSPQPGGSCAAPVCPGPLTADGLACCAPGSTPTGADTCTLPAGGLAASCPIAQLTVLGSCCPLSSSRQPDGTCQSANGSASASASASACPLGQLDKGGLSCCPAGMSPQADGSCQPIRQPIGPTPTCPDGSAPNRNGQCLAALVCSNGNQPLNGAGECCPPGSQYLTTTPSTTTGQGVSEFGQLMCAGNVNNPPSWNQASYYSCPSNVPSSSCYCSWGGCTWTQTYGVPTVPTCPPGATFASSGYGNSTTYSCVETGVEPSCQPPYVIFLNACVLPDCSGGGVRRADGSCVATQSTSFVTPSTPASGPGQCPAGLDPREAYSGDRLCVSHGVRGQTILDNIAAPSRTKPDGTCIQGYVWRQAIPSDHVCVTPATRTQAQSDNRTGAQMEGLVQRQVVPPQPGLTPPVQSGATTTTTHIPTNKTTPTTTGPVPCQLGEIRTNLGCENEPTQSNTNVQPPLKVLTPSKPVTVQKIVPPPRLNIAKPPPAALKLPSGPEDKQKR